MCSGTSSFHVLICHTVSALVKCLFKSIALFLIGLFEFLWLHFESSLYILNTSPLSDLWFFSQSGSYLFILLTVSFEEQKFSILMMFNLSNSYFRDDAFIVGPRKYLPNSRYQRIFSLFSFRSFIVIVFTFYVSFHKNLSIW